MKKEKRSLACVAFALCFAAASFLPAGCGEDKPGVEAGDAAVISVEPGPAAPRKIQAMPRTRYVKETVNKTMDQEAEKRATQMDQIFK